LLTTFAHDLYQLLFKLVSDQFLVGSRRDSGFIGRSPRTTRRHLTSRNHQFNAKAIPDTVKRFNPICDGQLSR
jgi:hypothetical protein